MKRTRLAKKGKSDTAKIKDNIQAYLRLCAVLRDGGCVLRSVRGCGATASVLNDKVVSNTIIQYDHLLSRANSGTFADLRLGVCVCKGCHAWKSLGSNLRKAEYDRMVKTIIPKDRVELWEKCELDMSAHKTNKMDWAMELLAIKSEYAKLVNIGNSTID